MNSTTRTDGGGDKPAPWSLVPADGLADEGGKNAPAMPSTA
jgi:hypothetical protein